MTELGPIIRNLADDVPGLVRGATANASAPGSSNTPQQTPGKGVHAAPPSPESPDFVRWLDENILCNTYFNLGLFALPTGLGLAGKGAGKLGMSGVAGTLEGLEKATFADVGRVTGLGGITSKLTDGVMHGASVLTKPLHWVGLTDLAAANNASAFAKHAGSMRKAARTMFAYAGGAPATSELGQALAQVEAHLSGPVHAVDFKGLSNAVEKVKGVADKIGHTKLSDVAGKLEGAAGKAEASLFFAQGWKDLEHHTKSAAGKMGGANLWHGLMNATFLAQAGVMDYNDTKDIGKNLRSLRTMHARLSHQKESDISTMDLLFGKVSQPVAAARSELMKEFGPAMVLDVANTVLNVKIMANSKFGGAAKSIAMLIALPMANMMIARGLLGGSLLPAYNAMNEAQAKGGQVPPEMYAKLLGNASKELHNLGGETSNFTKALGIFYAQHHASADVVLQEIDNGTTHKRMATLEKAYKAYIRQHPEQNPELKLAERNQAVTKQQVAHALEHRDHHLDGAEGISHVDRLNGKQTDRKVVGRQTERLHAEGQQPSHSPGMA